MADPILSEITRRIVSRVAPRQIFLFGSRARGDCRADSDYDILVIIDECHDRRAAALAIRRELSNLPAGKDILVATTEEASGSAGSCLTRSALKDARLLYDQPGS